MVCDETFASFPQPPTSLLLEIQPPLSYVEVVEVTHKRDPAYS
jgi:hypothetical protein